MLHRRKQITTEMNTARTVVLVSYQHWSTVKLNRIIYDEIVMCHFVRISNTIIRLTDCNGSNKTIFFFVISK